MSEAELSVKSSAFMYGCCLPLGMPVRQTGTGQTTEYLKKEFAHRVLLQKIMLNLICKIKKYILIYGSMHKIINAIYPLFSAAYQVTVLVMSGSR